MGIHYRYNEFLEQLEVDFNNRFIYMFYGW